MEIFGYVISEQALGSVAGVVLILSLMGLHELVSGIKRSKKFDHDLLIAKQAAANNPTARSNSKKSR